MSVPLPIVFRALDPALLISASSWKWNSVSKFKVAATFLKDFTDLDLTMHGLVLYI